MGRPVSGAETDTDQSAEGFVARHRLLLIALVLTVLFHGSLLLAGSYQRTYDAYVHIFFADHYARSWFSGWDNRWYTGFSTVSYPPGSHQAIAAVSFLLGLRTGFVVVQTFALLLLTVGVYRWAGIWVDRTSSGWAAILAVLSSSIAETVHVFGQLPTTLSLGFLLNALPFADRWVRTGSRRALAVAVACTMATTACHHVTTLFGAVFFVGPVLVSGLVLALRTPRPGEPDGHPAHIRARLLWPLIARRTRRILPALNRAMLYSVLLVAALVIVVLPYWLYSRSDPITQVSIPHASRDNFLVNRNAGLLFWLIPWGTTLLVLPYAFVRGFASRAWPLAASLAVLFVLGTGGTTPIPRMLLGGAYYILTLDRFTFWATISVLPLAGRFVASLVGGTIRQWLLAQLGRTLAAVLPIIVVLAHLAVTLFAANLTHYRPFQPPSINVSPVTAFLAKDNHDRWRYLALGLGDQMAWLAANTTAQTVDGDYHSARALPELTSRPVERLENSKFDGVPGIGSLQQFLAVPERYNLKYVFNNDRFYSPLLDASGWTDLGPLENGIEVWERADVAPLPAIGYSHEPPMWQRYEWGIVPPGSILAALLLLAWAACGHPGGRGRLHRARRLARPLTIPAALCRRVARLPMRPLRAIDTALLRAASRVPMADPAGAEQRWQRWQPVLEAVRQHARRPVIPRRRRRQGVVVVCVLLALPIGALTTLRPKTPTAEQVVTAYYNDLDVRRMAAAYGLLDPTTRPDIVQYQLNLNSDGGLVASFGKLNTVEVSPVETTTDRVILRTIRMFQTSVQSYDVTETVVLRRDAGTWRIELPAADPTQPSDQFTSRPEVGFLSQGRRSVTSGATATGDVLDRPQLQLRSLRSLRVDGRWVVIGEVTNVDVDPADVTVNAQMRDPSGHLIASWDAAQVMVHKLLPGESSPFRIEFQSIAGTGAYGGEADGGVKDASTAGVGVGAGAGSATSITVSPPTAVHSDLRGPVEFDPQTITPLTLPAGATVGSIGVYARAVVSPYVTPRGLQVVDAHLEGQTVVGMIRNDTTNEASVPHLLLAYTDSSGVLRWVDHAYLEHSVAAQRSSPFAIRLADPSHLRNAEIQPFGYAGPAHNPLAAPRDPFLTLPASSGFGGLRITATTYQRGPSS